MKHPVKLKVFVLSLCVLLSAMALPVSAYTDYTDVIKSVGDRITLKVGEQRHLGDYISYSSPFNEDKDEDGAEQWRITLGVKWTSSNPEIVSVDANGTATAHKAGYTRITATGWDNLGQRHEQRIMISVAGAGTGFTDTTPASSFEIVEGRVIDLGLLFFPGKTAVTWSSSHTEVASVDKDGTVTGNSIGRCTIQAVYTDPTGNTYTQKAQVRIGSMTAEERSKRAEITLRSGDAVDVVGLFYPLYPTNAKSDIKVTTNDLNIALLSGSSVTAAKSGSCVVTLSRRDGFEDIQIQKIIIRVS